MDPSKRRRREIRRRLLASYDAVKRDLPWRGERDPYRIWVSEIMLQQTRVETVVPYYLNWMNRFPDIEELAAADEDEVLGVWQGLGYYSRARRLHQGARLVKERYGGLLPGSSEELRSLPGVGEYTAGAVASIAFGQPVPAVDGNVRRVLCRLFDLPDPGPSELRRLAGILVDPRRPGDFNQAVMELGALVCVPSSPRCDLCPVNSLCHALEEGTVSERPRRKKRRAVPHVVVAVAVAVRYGQSGDGSGAEFFLRKRPPEGLLAGMWEFPGVEFGKVQGVSSEREAALSVAGEAGLVPAGGEGFPESQARELGETVHTFSHLKVHYRPYLFLSGGHGVGSGRWIREKDLGEVPLSVAQQKIAQSAREALSR